MEVIDIYFIRVLVTMKKAVMLSKSRNSCATAAHGAVFETHYTGVLPVCLS